jgi:hypothetical protein
MFLNEYQLEKTYEEMDQVIKKIITRVLSTSEFSDDPEEIIVNYDPSVMNNILPKFWFSYRAGR